MSKVQTSTFTESALSDKVKDFLIRFKDKFGNYKYVEQIDEMMPKNSKYILVDYNDLVVEPELASMFSDAPDKILDAFSRAIKEALQTRFSDYAEKIKDEVRVRLVNYPLQRSLRQITAETIGNIVSVSGMVVRSSEVKPLAKELIFVCPDEHPTKVIQLQSMDVKTPVVCDSPNCKHRDFELKPEASKFIDFQILRLQELPEDLPPGQLPHYIDVTIRQDLVDNARPGDSIILTGIVRIEQESVAGVPRGHSGLYRLRIEGNNIEFLGGRGNKSSRKIQREEILPEDEKLIRNVNMWEAGRKELNLTEPNSFGIQMISSYISIIIELQIMARYI